MDVCDTASHCSVKEAEHPPASRSSVEQEQPGEPTTGTQESTDNSKYVLQKTLFHIGVMK